MSAMTLQNDILHIGSSPSADLNIKKWRCNVSALSVKHSFKDANKAKKKKKKKKKNAKMRYPMSLCGRTTYFKLDTASK